MYFRKLQRCVYGLFCLEFFSFILAERGKEEEFYTVNTSRKGGKKGGIFLFSTNESYFKPWYICYAVLKCNSIIKKSFLLQVSQYTFAMCSYREKKSEPQELMQLEGYTVDYTAPHTGTFHDFEVGY